MIVIELFVLICALVAMGVFLCLMMLPIVGVQLGFYYLFIKIIEKNQMKVVTNGYKLLFYLYISEEIGSLKCATQVKLVELARTSETHKKMFKFFLEQKEFGPDFFYTCLCDEALALLRTKPYNELYEVYEKNYKNKKKPGRSYWLKKYFKKFFP